MPLPQLTYKADELIAKKTGKNFIIPLIIPLIALTYMAFNYEEGIIWFKKNPIGCIFLISFLLFLSIYFLYQIFDKGIKLVINEFGIWTKKHELIPWDAIDAFYFEKAIGKTISYFLWIDTKIIGESFKFDITYLDKHYIKITTAIENNSKGYEIRHSGVHEYEI